MQVEQSTSGNSVGDVQEYDHEFDMLVLCIVLLRRLHKAWVLVAPFLSSDFLNCPAVAFVAQCLACVP